MRIEIHDNLLTIKEEDGTVIRTVQSTSYIIYPDEGKKLLDKTTGRIINSFVGVNDKNKISNYEDV